jgi:hypothetical protein
LPPAAEGRASPEDVEARYRHKRDTPWPGSMVHGSETCAPTEPPRLTQGPTTPATVHAAQCTAPSQPARLAPDLAPGEPLVDAASSRAEWLVHSRDDQGLRLRGPTRPRQGWQTPVQGAYTRAQLAVAWAQPHVRCPQGHLAVAWGEHGGGQGRRPSMVACDKHTCGTCPVRPCCPRAQHTGRRLRLPPQDQSEALQAAQTWSASEAGQPL